MAKIFYFDVETTGLDHKKAAMHQLAGAIEIDGLLVEKFKFNIAPMDIGIENVLQANKWTKIYFNKEHTGAALDMAGVSSLEELRDRGEDPIVVMRKIIKMMEAYVNQYDKSDKFFLCGYNNRRFDDHIFRQWFTDLEYKWFGSWFWNDTLDVIVLASYALMEERHRMADFKLATVAQYLNIPVKEDSLHDALYDIDLTREILQKVNQRVNERYATKGIKN